MNDDAPEASGASIRVNGERRPLVDSAITGLLAELGYSTDSQGIAIAVNGRVIPRNEWPQIALADGDTVEVVGAVQGG